MKISKEVKIGIVTLVTIVGFFILYNFLKGKNVFTSGNIYKVNYENVNGLAPSKAVSINGLRVGRVEEINIKEDKVPIYFEVVISVEKDLKFSKETVAEIYEPGLLSGSEIRLLLEYGNDVAKNGDFLKGKIAGGMVEGLTKQLAPTQTKIDSVLVTLNKTLSNVNNILDTQGQEDIKKMLHNLNNTIVVFQGTAKSLETTSNSANTLIKSNEKAINQTLVASQNTVSKFGQTADKINSLELDKTFKNFEEMSNKLNNLLTDINQGKGTLGKLTKDDALANDLQATIKNMNLLLEDFKKNPSRYVNISVFGKKQPIQP